MSVLDFLSVSIAFYETYNIILFEFKTQVMLHTIPISTVFTNIIDYTVITHCISLLPHSL